MKPPFLLMCLLASVACGLADGVDIAERAVVAFHARYEAGSFDVVHEESAEDLRAIEPRTEFVATMASIRAKLGSIRASNRTGFSARIGSDGTFVEIEYETSFEHGVGTEEFIWEITDGRAKLLSYNVSSKALLR